MKFDNFDDVKDKLPLKYPNEVGIITYKLDGVRVHIKNGLALSRKDKVLYNVPPLEDGVYECYLGSFKETVSRLKIKDGEEIDKNNFYRLDVLDSRLYLQDFNYTDIHLINDLLADVNKKGYEGLVIHPHSPKMNYIKVKPSYTFDVVVTGITEGQGKYTGIIGALITEKGKVSSGLSDEDRRHPELFLYKTIEVECMQLTADGKFRHPRLIRLRPDKD